MTRAIRKFVGCDQGAVTVDWVVLSAAILGIGMLVLVPIAYGTDSMAQRTADLITSSGP
jgi:hypothetical protein